MTNKLYSSNRNVTAKRWTKKAIDCYNRGCVCSGCFYEAFFRNSEQSCKMKLAVIDLVRELGPPKAEKEKKDLILN